jgi:hypothetical protein
VITTDPQHLADQIARAVGDPGSVVKRRHADFGGVGIETVTRWSARAALTRVAGDFSSTEMSTLIGGVLANPEWETDRQRADAVCLKLAALFGEAAES